MTLIERYDDWHQDRLDLIESEDPEAGNAEFQRWYRAKAENDDLGIELLHEFALAMRSLVVSAKRVGDQAKRVLAASERVLEGGSTK